MNNSPSAAPKCIACEINREGNAAGPLHTCGNYPYYHDPMTEEQKGDDRPAYLWDDKAKQAARKVGGYMQEPPKRSWEEEFDRRFTQNLYGEFSSMDQRIPIKAFLAHTIEEVEARERLRAFEILHKYAMKTKKPESLDLIEAAQKEILANPTIRG